MLLQLQKVFFFCLWGYFVFLLSKQTASDILWDDIFSIKTNFKKTRFYCASALLLTECSLTALTQPRSDYHGRSATQCANLVHFRLNALGPWPRIKSSLPLAFNPRQPGIWSSGISTPNKIWKKFHFGSKRAEFGLWQSSSLVLLWVMIFSLLLFPARFDKQLHYGVVYSSSPLTPCTVWLSDTPLRVNKQLYIRIRLNAAA